MSKKVKVLTFLFLFPLFCYSSSLMLLENGKKPLPKISNPLYDVYCLKHKKIYVFESVKKTVFGWGWTTKKSSKVHENYKKSYVVIGYAVNIKGKCQRFYIRFAPQVKHILSFTDKKNQFVWKYDKDMLSKNYEVAFEDDQNIDCYKELQYNLKNA